MPTRLCVIHALNFYYIYINRVLHHFYLVIFLFHYLDMLY